MSMKSEKAAFCAAVQMNGGEWSYSISPGALVKYKRGELPIQTIVNVPA